MARNLRNKNLRVLLSAEEQRMVKALAKRQGLTVADVVRQLIRASHQDVLQQERAS